MLKLDNPVVTFSNLIRLCEQGIGGRVESTRALKRRLQVSKQQLLLKDVDYISSAATNELHSLPICIVVGDEDPIIVGELTRDDLEKLYSQYIVPDSTPARAEIYDVIMNAANEECPFCGGIGIPKNLDHFLPKAHFPQYSLLPLNLVPSCETCNMGEKGVAYAACAEEQFIHPYLDIDLFFNSQWIFSRFNTNVEGQIGEFEYFITFGNDWSNENKKRAAKHFKDFKLAGRYSTQAGRELRGAWGQIKAMLLGGCPKENVIDYIFTPKVDSAPHVNHWEASMYQALIHWLGQTERETLVQLGLLE
ncbi:HNH nuclease [Moritella viscosa]|uniref:HNH endonuclease n=1 Tax=Moritella viscosa TaxID=80854 RepID=UPI00091930E5|nr:HNH endonuclease signature motif containing protein [Moritella viscosa]SGZ08097.1 HNH nuclease [Moritella viscosa]